MIRAPVLLSVLLAALPVALTPLPGLAQAIPCAPRERVLSHLIDRLGAVRQAEGLAGQGARMELYADPDGGWTVLLHLPDGRSCLLAGGSEFRPTGGLQPARGRPA